MTSAIVTPVHARPSDVILLRDGERIPLELSFDGLDHNRFGLWRVSTPLRRSDRLSVTGLGFNFIRVDYEQPKTVDPCPVA